MEDYESSSESYGSALTIRMEMAKTNPMVYLPEASCTLSNLAFFYFKSVPNREKSVDYALETIKVLLPIYEQVPFTQTYLRTAITVLKSWNFTNEEIDHLIEARVTSS
jgi:hypothetical protein